MKVVDHINNAKNLTFSYEILPPLKGANINPVFEMLSQIKAYSPAWINVTSHASSMIYKEHQDGNIKRHIYKKRNGTVGICGIIKNKFDIEAVAHLLCQGFSREETENALIELSYLGIENILALKGDNLNYNKDIAKEKSVNNYAYEAVTQIVDMRRGKFLDGEGHSALDFCVGVAGYPEKHIEAANPELDIKYLKHKVDAGAQYIITQMFFDNSKFFNFVAACRANGILVPIIPGIKFIKSLKQVTILPKMFNIDIPTSLVGELTKFPEHGVKIGKEWMINQINELAANGIKNIHCFLMNDLEHVLEVLDNL